MRIFTRSTVREITSAGVVVVGGQGEEEVIATDTLVVARKLRPNRELWETLEGEVEELYAVGDCVAPRKAINAIHEGFRVGVRI